MGAFVWLQEEEVSDERLISGEEQVTLITDSMSITPADEEKLRLLNKNTELRRLNKELMKLNEDWDHIYRSTTQGLQQRLESLEQENSSVQQLNSRLLLKVEHEQSKREYYEHTLMQELKKNQQLQEYIRLLEESIHRAAKQNTAAKSRLSESDPTTKSTSDRLSPASLLQPLPFLQHQSSRSKSVTTEHKHGQREVQDLKEQLEALKCQTRIYEADYKAEHRGHERVLQVNRQLRRREGEMRQQMALLQEQLKVYEDDFQRERSDKQVLQRLLMKKSLATKEPVLVHRCNSDHQWHEDARRKRREEPAVGGGHPPTCPKHCSCPLQGEYP
ncbi:TNFAIP3-interacting protein 1 isoform X2 [Denticeps clupeoides]|uniref:TNFAIP3-interacting protein 1 isoform X2 n=1 Tax=Denticeps clupeoides TaxID=299321 RepID=UPI0010A517DC|nr:TNFAIP3-interacting protein 1-like isoform X2 [Denticeps clupeoides]